MSASYIIRFNVIDLSPQDGQSTPVFIIMLDLLQSNAGGGADQRTPPTRPVEILCDEPGSASKVCISRMHPSCAPQVVRELNGFVAIRLLELEAQSR